jgi:Flp pilus assembly protein TadD
MAALQKDYNQHARKRFLEGNLFLANLNPPDATACATVGTILYAQGRDAEAERYLRTALRVNTNHAQAHYGIGLLSRKGNRLDEARAAFERALELAPGDARAHGNLGYVCLALGDFASAEKHFREALRVNSNDPLAREGLADIQKARTRR